MVTVTQEGNLSVPKCNALFEGITFYVSLHVPGRGDILDKVRINGGKNCYSAKDADIRIVDHKRPPEAMDKPMYSYLFITKSVANARLEKLEKYLVEPAAPPQPAPSAKSGSKSVKTARKGPRNFFTAEEDLILLRHIRNCAHLNGNKIYQELEAEHPSHSYQGWRERWVKHYSKLNPNPEYCYLKLKKQAKGGASPKREVSPAALPKVRSPTSPVLKGLSKATPRPKPSLEGLPKSLPAKPLPKALTATPLPKALPRKPPQSTSMTSFTDHDANILHRYHHTVSRASDPLEVWEQLQEKYPHHSALQWRKHYMAQVLPKLQNKPVSEPSPTPLPSARWRAAPNTPKKRKRPELDLEIPSTPEAPTPKRRREPSPELLGSMSPVEAQEIEVVSASEEEVEEEGMVEQEEELVEVKEEELDPQSPLPSSPAGPEEEREEEEEEEGVEEEEAEDGQDPDLIIPPLPSSPAAPEQKEEEVIRERGATNRSRNQPKSPRSKSPAAEEEEEEEEEEEQEAEEGTTEEEQDPDLKIPSLSPTPILKRSPPPPYSDPRTAPSAEANGADPDLAIPPLSDSDDDPEDDTDLRIPSLPPSRSPSPAPSPSSTIAAMRALKQRYNVPKSLMQYAMQRTSAVPELMEKVIVADLTGEGLPRCQGVWTEEEDDILRRGTAREIESLAREGWEERVSFLEACVRGK